MDLFNQSKLSNDNYSISILKITALWAFSESAFGGILHALTIPFRGLFISSAAVLFISLIALFSKSSRQILKATIIVILIKALVSPHSPLTAYFAVSIQGLLGYLLFSSKKFFSFSALLLGIITLLFSGIQKIVVLTILFGNTLWDSIDFFFNQVLKEFLNLGIHSDVHYGYLLMGIYVSIHILTGIFIGFYAGRLPKILKYYSQQIPKNILDGSENEIPRKDKKKKKKSWLFRPTGIIILTFSIAVLVFTYIYPSENKIAKMELIIMIIRSVVLTFIWYVLIAPIVKKVFNKYLSNKKSIYAKEIDEMMNMFPQFRKVIAYCWKDSKGKYGLKRIYYFLSTSFYYLLLGTEH